MRAYSSAKRFNREFWTNFLTPCLAMEMAKWPFDQIDDKHAELVRLVLEKLETVVGMKEADLADVRLPISLCYNTSAANG